MTLDVEAILFGAVGGILLAGAGLALFVGFVVLPAFGAFAGRP